MKLGVSKRTIQNMFQTNAVNAAGGTAFDVNDPSQRLLHIVGHPGFNEPRSFYSIPPSLSPQEIRNFTADIDGLTGMARTIIDTAIEIATGPNPKDLLHIAHWLRVDGYCRTTPGVLLAVAAAIPATKPFVREYCPKIIRRADEIAATYGAYRYLFGKPIPSALLKGLKDSFGNFDEHQLIKYNQKKNNPSLKDVILQVPNRKPDSPVSRGLAEYLINGTLVDKNGVDHSETAPVTAAHLAFVKEANRANAITPQLLELANRARATWELMTSLLGNRKEVWESVLPRMGYMAILRNLRNMIDAGVDSQAIVDRLQDRKSVLRSKQFPFRFLAALRSIDGSRVPSFSGCRGYASRSLARRLSIQSSKRVKDAIVSALDISVENVGNIPGSTLVLVDVSGSMNSSLSAKSSLTQKEAAALMAGICVKASDECYVYAFAHDAVLVDARKQDSVLSIFDRIIGTQVGTATYAYKAMEMVLRDRIHVDRIIILSDMQCYHDRASNLQDVIGRYKRSVNSDVWVHSVNLNANDCTSQIASGQSNVNLVSGFSDKILGQLVRAESGQGEIPALSYIRDNF